MNRKKLILIVALAIIIVISGGLGAFIVMTRDSTEANQTVTIKPLTKQQMMNEGTKAESTGDTQTALKAYEEAQKLCKSDDQVCKIDTTAKIEAMKLFLAQEEKAKK